ncbi:MAG: Lrp/AsnC ligand binding domain-containing protein [Actinomycetaceae bacterium]|nr:Lrp/AsnC ligand binding domain-containing protein [Actinomycetaceae bacterium]
MLTAIVMIRANIDQIPEVAQKIADVEGVREVYSVTGDDDLIAIVRVREHEDLARVVPDSIGKIPGVRYLKTHIAFREYSQADLEAGFHLGIE